MDRIYSINCQRMKISIILGILKSGGKIYLAFKKAQTSSGTMELNDFEEVSFESLKDKIIGISKEF